MFPQNMSKDSKDTCKGTIRPFSEVAVKINHSKWNLNTRISEISCNKVNEMCQRIQKNTYRLDQAPNRSAPNVTYVYETQVS
jgi:hypothetical protein